MKYFILLVTMLAILTVSGQATPENSNPEIKKAVRKFSKLVTAGDEEGLKGILHSKYRYMWHDGSKEPFILDASGYIAMIKKAEQFRQVRTITIESVKSYDGVNAIVQAISDTESETLRSLFSLIKVNGKWVIIQELTVSTFMG